MQVGCPKSAISRHPKAGKFLDPGDRVGPAGGISSATYTVVSVTPDRGHDASDMDHRGHSFGDHLRLLDLLRRIDLGGEAIMVVLHAIEGLVGLSTLLLLRCVPP